MPNLCGKLIRLKKSHSTNEYVIFHSECDFPKMSKTFKPNNLNKSFFYVIDLMDRKDLIYGIYKVLHNDKILYFNEYFENHFEEVRDEKSKKTKNHSARKTCNQ